MRSVLGKLVEDGCEVDPDVLAPDVAVAGELHDVQQPELERPAPAFEPEWRAGRAAAPHRLVHEESLAVEPTYRLDRALGQIREEALVEGARLFTAPGRP